MSALHRLKAYFGMVPVEDFDPTEFSPEDFDGYQSSYGSGSVNASPRSSPVYGNPHGNPYDDGFPAQVGHPAAPRAHLTRPPSWATESWTTKAPVSGSLAIDTASTPRQPTSRLPMSHQPMPHQPAVPQPFTSMPSTGSVTEESLAENGAHPLARIVTLHPHNYNEARPIGERYREGNPVIMNLTEMQDQDAKRLVDFAAGLAFALRGSIDKITNKVFLLSPPNIDVSPEDRRRIAEGRLFD
jgi:cell division inhibitor SepF